MLSALTPAALPAAELSNSELAKKIAALEERTALLEQKNQALENENARLTKTIRQVEVKVGDQSAGEGRKPKEAAGKKSKDGGAEAILDGKTKDKKLVDMTVKEASDAFGVPESPAAAVLGLKPDKVQHVTTPKQLIPAFLSGLDEHGHFQSGLAVDFAPFQFLWGNRPVTDFRGTPRGMLAFDENWQPYLERVLLRTQISFAATKGASDADKSTKIALGLHSVLAAANDPLAAPDDTSADKLNSRGLALNEWVTDLDHLGSFDFLDRKSHLFTEENFMGRMANKMWSHVSWSIGGAPSWIARDANGNRFDYNGTSLWSSFSYSPTSGKSVAANGETNWLNALQVFADINYQNGEKVSAVDANDKATSTAANSGASADRRSLISQDTLFVVAGLRVGTNDFHATATGALIEQWQSNHGNDQAFRYGLALEQRMSDGSWLTLSVEKDTGHSNGRNPTVVLGGVKIGFGGRDFTGKDQNEKRGDQITSAVRRVLENN